MLAVPSRNHFSLEAHSQSFRALLQHVNILMQVLNLVGSTL